MPEGRGFSEALVMSAALVTQDQLSEIAAAVDAESNYWPDAHSIECMTIAMFRLQHIYERDRSSAAAREKELRDELEICTAECQGLAEENNMLFNRAATRLAYIKELEAELAAMKGQG